MYEADNKPIFDKIGYNVFQVTRTSTAGTVTQIYLENTVQYLDIEFFKTDGDWRCFEEVSDSKVESKYKIGRKEGNRIIVLKSEEMTEETAKLLISVLITETSNEYCIVVNYNV